MRLSALLLLGLSLPALAGDHVPLRERLTPDELREIGLTDAQIEKLDAALRAAEARTPPGSADPALKGALAERAQPRVGLGDEPIVARATGRIASWAPGTVFTLDNGQRWQVLKGSATLRAPLDSPRVRVLPGFSGRWFLEVAEDMPKARVFLLD